MSNRRLMLIGAMWAALAGASAGSADAQSTAPAGTQFVLSGVVVSEGGGRAWLQEPTLTRNEIVSVRPGDSIGPYRLTKVLEDRVELEGPGGTLSVRLAGPSTVAASSPPPAPLQEPVPVTQQKPRVDAGTTEIKRFDFRDFGSLLNSIAGDRH